MVHYFDYSATSLKKPKNVIDKVYEVISSANYANPSRGSYSLATSTFKEVYEARRRIANFFGMDDERNLIFTSNSTEALNMVIKGLLKEGDHVIYSSMEHNSVIRPIYEKNISYDIIPSNGYGVVQYEKIEDMIRKNTKLVVITHASNVTGNIVDIERVSKICKRHNILLLVDASQTAGVIDINIKNMGVDFLCFTGHKSMFGPQGIGGLCINNFENKLKKYNVGGSGVDSFNKNHPEEYPERLEAGTLNTLGILGLSAGVEYIEKTGIANLYEKQKKFADKFYKELRMYKELEFYGDFKGKKVAVVAMNFKNIPASEIADILNEEYDICVRSGAHCAPLMHKVLGTEKQGIVRFSFSSMNTEEEVDYAVYAIKDIIKRL